MQTDNESAQRSAGVAKYTQSNQGTQMDNKSARRSTGVIEPMQKDKEIAQRRAQDRQPRYGNK